MFGTLIALWKDEEGAILSAEYLTLGGIVALGSAAGMVEVRDSVNAECKDYGMAVREINASARASAVSAIQNPQVRKSQYGSAPSDSAPQGHREYQFMTP